MVCRLLGGKKSVRDQPNDSEGFLWSIVDERQVKKSVHKAMHLYKTRNDKIFVWRWGFLYARL